MLKILKQENILIAVSLIIFATMMRLSIPPVFGHIPNFSPIMAIALFAGVMMRNRWLGLLCAMICIGISDFVVNSLVYQQVSIIYDGFYWQYGCYFIICLLGYQLRNHLKLLNVFYASLAGSLIFYALSNFGVWASGALYPKTLEGLVACYVAAIPFFKNSLASNFIFSAMLYVGWCEVYRDRRLLQG